MLSILMGHRTALRATRVRSGTAKRNLTLVLVAAQPANTDLQRVISDVKGLDNLSARIVGFFQLQS